MAEWEVTIKRSAGATVPILSAVLIVEADDEDTACDIAWDELGSNTGDAHITEVTRHA